MDDIAIDLSHYVIIIYPMVGLILIAFYSFPKTKNKASLVSQIINIVFGVWLITISIISLIETKKETDNLLYDKNDPSEWLFYFSVIVILLAICFKKIRSSPFSILAVCIVLVINYLVIMANFKVGI